MLVNCVAYQDGKKLADIAKENISDYVSRPESLTYTRQAGASPIVAHSAMSISREISSLNEILSGLSVSFRRLPTSTWPLLRSTTNLSALPAHMRVMTPDGERSSITFMLFMRCSVSALVHNSCPVWLHGVP